MLKQVSRQHGMQRVVFREGRTASPPIQPEPKDSHRRQAQRMSSQVKLGHPYQFQRAMAWPWPWPALALKACKVKLSFLGQASAEPRRLGTERARNARPWCDGKITQTTIHRVQPSPVILTQHLTQLHVWPP